MEAAGRRAYAKQAIKQAGEAGKQKAIGSLEKKAKGLTIGQPRNLDTGKMSSAKKKVVIGGRIGF